MRLELPERRKPPAPAQLTPLGDGLGPIIEQAIESQPPVGSEPDSMPPDDEDIKSDEGIENTASEPASGTAARSAGWVVPALVIGGMAALFMARRPASAPIPTPQPVHQHPQGPGHGPGHQQPAPRRVIE